MGDLLNKVKEASEGKPYTGNGMTEKDSGNNHQNQDNVSATMNNPLYLQHSYDGQKTPSKPMILISEEEKKK